MAPSEMPIQTKDYMSLLSEFPPNTPCTVFHMLKFKTTAAYPPGSLHSSLPAVSGREAFFNRYVKAGEGAAKEVGISPAEQQFFSSHVVNLLRHNEVAWDVVSIRKYASFEQYAKYQSSAAYQTNAVPHRDAALEDWFSLLAPRGLPREELISSWQDRYSSVLERAASVVEVLSGTFR